MVPDRAGGDLDHATTDVVNTSTKKLVSPPRRPSSLHYDDEDPRPRTMEAPAGEKINVDNNFNSTSTYNYPGAAARDHENAALLLSAGDEVVVLVDTTSATNGAEVGHVHEHAAADQEQEMENDETQTTPSSREGCCRCTKMCVLILLLIFLVLAGGACVFIFVPWFDGWTESWYTRWRKGWDDSQQPSWPSQPGSQSQHHVEIDYNDGPGVWPTADLENVKEPVGMMHEKYHGFLTQASIDYVERNFYKKTVVPVPPGGAPPPPPPPQPPVQTKIPRNLILTAFFDEKDVTLDEFLRYQKWRDPTKTEGFAQWAELNAGPGKEFEVKFFNLNAAREYLQEHYKKEMLWAFDAFDTYCMKSDLFRLLVLYREGGVYIDWKLAPVVDWDKLLEMAFSGTEKFRSPRKVTRDPVTKRVVSEEKMQSKDDIGLIFACQDFTFSFGVEDPNFFESFPAIKQLPNWPNQDSSLQGLMNAFIAAKPLNLLLGDMIYHLFRRVELHAYGNTVWDTTGPIGLYISLLRVDPATKVTKMPEVLQQALARHQLRAARRTLFRTGGQMTQTSPTTQRHQGLINLQNRAQTSAAPNNSTPSNLAGFLDSAQWTIQRQARRKNGDVLGKWECSQLQGGPGDAAFLVYNGGKHWFPNHEIAYSHPGNDPEMDKLAVVKNVWSGKHAGGGWNHDGTQALPSDIPRHLNGRNYMEDWKERKWFAANCYEEVPGVSWPGVADKEYQCR
ncbi:unnamed protein product [Amoebophrya sp. A120]|nr:unnamed protein product [Amoebophrya sp. A120]|eukprot:GSA120T00022191001.1